MSESDSPQTIEKLFDKIRESLYATCQEDSMFYAAENMERLAPELAKKYYSANQMGEEFRGELFNLAISLLRIVWSFK